MDFTMKKVMDDHNCNIRWKEGICITDLNLANDVALLANTRVDLQSLTTNLETETGKIRLRLNSEKMKIMLFPSIIIGLQTAEVVKSFTYLGTIMDAKGKVEADISSRIGITSLMFQRLHLIWSMSTISLRTKICLYKIFITPIATYASKM